MKFLSKYDNILTVKSYHLYVSRGELMNKTDFVKEMEFKRNLNDVEYLVYKIYFNAAPTVKGLKPSTLLNFRNMAHMNLFDIWNKNKDFLKDKLHIKFMELKRSEDGVIVLFYNEEMMKNILCENENECFLRDRGFKNCRAVDFALHDLKMKFRETCPDEVGVFLGYPLSDVKMFLTGNTRACKLSRYWKAYTDIPKALVTWEQYDKALEDVMEELLKCRSPLEVLA